LVQFTTVGCYTASGTGEAQSAFLGGGLGATTETITAPQTADCVSPNTGSIRYPEVDFSAGDAPLSTAQNNSYESSSTYSKCGFARVTPVAGASLPEAFNTSGLPTDLTISNLQLCGIWKGTITNWTAVTNQATGKPASTASLGISVVYRSDGSGSTFIHTAHLNTVCTGGYGPVGTSFPTAAAGKAKLIGAVGSGGVASAIEANKGAIGYVAPNSLISGETSAAILNKSGEYYTPTAAAITSAFTSPTDTTPPSGYPAPSSTQRGLYLTNPSASGSYAEVGFIHAFVYTCYATTFGIPASKVASFFDGTVYASKSVTQTGLVNLSSAIVGTAKP
jgi:phosphate transport system substrate-binding protein